jgi:RNA polymerase sigma-70 factor (ECF subfamily)
MKTGHEPDEWLMGQVALGRRECLEPLVRRFASPLLTFLHRMCGDRHRSEELFQEVFLQVWLKRGQYRFPKSFKAWLFAIAANRCRAEHRKAEFRLGIVGGEWLEDVVASPTGERAGPLETAIDLETAKIVAAEVAALPTQQRAVLAMRVWNGMSYAEIAESLGRTEATVRSHMHHALASLRGPLEKHMREE